MSALDFEGEGRVQCHRMRQMWYLVELEIQRTGTQRARSQATFTNEWHTLGARSSEPVFFSCGPVFILSCLGELMHQQMLERTNPEEFKALLERNGITYDPNYVRGGWKD